MNRVNADIFNDDLDILELIEYGFPKKVYIRPNYFEELDQLTFFKRFRLYKETVLHLLEQLEHELEFPNDRNNSVSPINQVLCCLRFFASSGHISSVADFMGMDVSTASRIILKVSTAIARLSPLYINMPEEQNFVRAQQQFYKIARFPRVIGLVDGTHIKIQSPGGDAEVYRNRKSYFSLNVQVIGSADLKFLDIVARWPGSTHDSTIFSNSNIRARFEAEHFPNCLLIGDSGYALRPYFLTPLADPRTRTEQLYNESLIRTRNGVERLIGVWKRRFPIIAYGTRLKLETVKIVVIATAVLHNIAREMNETEPPVPDDINLEELNYLIETGDLNDILGDPVVADQNLPVNYTQNDLIHNYFATL